MGVTLLASSNAVSTNLSTASTSFFFAPGGNLVPLAVASNVFAIPFPFAGTIGNLAINVVTNARTSATIVRVNINGFPGNSSINVAAAATGIKTNLVNTDSINPGDLVTFEILTGTGSGNFALDGSVTATFTSTQYAVPAVCSASVSTGRTPGSGTRFMSLSGNLLSWSATEPIVSNELPQCQLSNIFAFATSAISSTTITARANTADLTNVISIGGSASGLFQDTTHTDNIAAGSLVDLKYIGAIGGGWTTIGGWLTSKPLTPFYVGNNRQLGFSFTGGTTNFISINGGPSSSTIEANAQGYIAYPWKWSGLSIIVATNTAASNITVTSRINGGAGKQSITIPAGVTGTFTDALNADILSPSNLINIEITGGTSGALSINDIFFSLTDTNGFVPPGQANKGKGAPGKSGDKGNRSSNNPPPISNPPVEYTGYQLSFPNIRYNNKPIGYIRHVSIGGARRDHLPLLGVT